MQIIKFTNINRRLGKITLKVMNRGFRSDHQINIGSYLSTDLNEPKHHKKLKMFNLINDNLRSLGFFWGSLTVDIL